MDEHLRAAHRLMWHDELEGRTNGGTLRPEVLPPCRSNRTGKRIVFAIAACLILLIGGQVAIGVIQHIGRVHDPDVNVRLQQMIEENDRMIQLGNDAIRGLDEQIHRARTKVQRRWDLYKDKAYKPSVIWANDDVTVERWD